MTANPAECDAVRESLAELALGVLPAPEADLVGAHIDVCPTCRAELDSLASAADALTRATPPVEPPAGFESRALARVELERRATTTPNARRLASPRARVVAAAAAVAAAAVLVVAGLLIGRRTGARSRPQVATAAMVTPSGATVGRAQVADDPHSVFVALPGWQQQAGAHEDWYRLRLTLDDGRTVTVGPVAFSNRNATWGGLTTVDAAHVRTVAMVDAAGHVYCSARLT